MEKHFFPLRPATLLKGKARDAEEVALIYKNPRVKSLSTSGLWYSTEGCREAYIVPEGNTSPCLLPQEIQGWYCFGPLPRYPNSDDKLRQIW